MREKIKEHFDDFKGWLADNSSFAAVLGVIATVGLIITALINYKMVFVALALAFALFLLGLGIFVLYNGLKSFFESL